MRRSLIAILLAIGLTGCTIFDDTESVQLPVDAITQDMGSITDTGSSVNTEECERPGFVECTPGAVITCSRVDDTLRLTTRGCEIGEVCDPVQKDCVCAAECEVDSVRCDGASAIECVLNLESQCPIEVASNCAEACVQGTCQESECSVGEAPRCIDRFTSQSCEDVGVGRYTSEICQGGDECNAVTGQCDVPAPCTEGQFRCADSDTVAVCERTMMSTQWIEDDCAPDTVCDETVEDCIPCDRSCLPEEVGEVICRATDERLECKRTSDFCFQFVEVEPECKATSEFDGCGPAADQIRFCDVDSQGCARLTTFTCPEGQRCDPGKELCVVP